MNEEIRGLTVKQEKDNGLQETRLSEQYEVSEAYLLSLGIPQDRVNHMMYMRWLFEHGKINKQ